MYDWPEVRNATDALWACLRDSLFSFGFPAPDFLKRGECDTSLWSHPGLVIGQTCGLPLVSGLEDTVSVVGTPAYEIECGAGCYYSVIVVRQDSTIACERDLIGSRLAYNGPMSQSGYGALAYHLRDLCNAGPVFSGKTVSGSHRQSLRLVAEGKAEVASIDAVSWQLALRHEPAANALRVLTHTQATPGLPLVCAKHAGWSVSRMHMAVIEAMAALDPATSEALLLTGFAQTCLSDYAVIARHWKQTHHLSLCAAA
jgi:ABC-type phosphate/phosphonate transport system substrate-binding protein